MERSDDWIIPVPCIPVIIILSPAIDESSHFYLCTSINCYTGIRDTNRAGIYSTIAINAATFAMYSLRGNPPFLTRFRSIYKEYFVDSDSEDDGILFQWKMFVEGQLI